TSIDAPELSLEALRTPSAEPPTRPRVRPRPRRHGRWAAIVALAALAIGAGAYALWPDGPPDEPPRDPPPPVRLPVEAPRAAQLRVASEPPGAAILVDGIQRGAAPLVVTLEAGSHVIE